VTTEQTEAPHYTVTCESCGETARLTAGPPVIELEMSTFLAAHVECEQFAITLSVPAQS
jgi:hypothetical protein